MTTAAAVIRRAETRDLPDLGRLGATLVRAHYEFDPRRFLPAGPETEDGYAWFLGTQLEEPDAAIYVAEMSGAVVGYAYAAIEPLSWQELREESGFIHDLVVAESARGSGIGTALLAAVSGWIAARGQTRIVLWTAADNEAAQRLFTRLGFRRTMTEMTRNIDPATP